MAFLFAPAAISVSFPSAEGRVFHPGDVVSGFVHLRVDANSKGKPTMDRVDLLLGGTQRTTFAFRSFLSPAATAQRKVEEEVQRNKGGPVLQTPPQQEKAEVWEEKIELYSEEQTIWRSTSHPPLGFDGTSVTLPFAFVLPASFKSFPPSFEGGSRPDATQYSASEMERQPPTSSDPWKSGRETGLVQGHDVARVQYYIHVTGRKHGIFSINERTRLPFTFSPSPTIDLSTIPELPSQEEIMPPDHPHHLLPPAPAGWTTTIIEHSICDGWWPWSKKGVIKLTFAFPPLPSGIPLAHPIPFLLHLTSRPSQPSNPSPFQTLNLTLNRTVFTLARGSGQLVPQRGLKPFWSINVGNWERGQSGDRNITTAGAIEIPVDGGVSFGTERTKGMLGCEHHISLYVPIKGLGNDLCVEKFLSLPVARGYKPENRAALEEKREVEASAVLKEYSDGKKGMHEKGSVEMSENI